MTAAFPDIPGTPYTPASSNGVLLVSCPDAPGVVASLAEAIWRHGGNIIDAQQHRDATDGLFLQRVEFDTSGLDLPVEALPGLLAPVRERFGMSMTVHAPGVRPRMAILASRAPHCLVDLLGRNRAGELAADLILVASNHTDHADLCAFHGVPFHHVPVDESAGPAGRAAQEAALDDLLRTERVDLVVLARYMRVLSPGFVATRTNRIVNIHHSFLPAFAGARPYRQAHDRGVKIIGATAHFVTAELDEGPIIEQDVVRVTHRDDVPDLERKGRDLEVIVLARALRAVLEHRVLAVGHRTVVFD